MSEFKFKFEAGVLCHACDKRTKGAGRLICEHCGSCLWPHKSDAVSKVAIAVHKAGYNVKVERGEIQVEDDAVELLDHPRVHVQVGNMGGFYAIVNAWNAEMDTIRSWPPREQMPALIRDLAEAVKSVSN